MYKWDLVRIIDNLNMIRKSTSPEFYKRQLSSYKDAISKYIINIDEEKTIPPIDKEIIHQFVSINFEDLCKFRDKNQELYEKLKSVKQIKTSIKTRINHNFDLDEVYDISKSFLYSINRHFGLQLELMKMDKRLTLNKSNKNNAAFYQNTWTLDSLVGVNARNKEEMVFSLVHELGHSIKTYETNNSFGETLPILLELYLNDFMRENKIKYNTLPYLNSRFVLERNEIIEILKQYSKVNLEEYKETDIDKVANEHYINKKNYLFSIKLVLEYFLASEVALDLYKKGQDKNQTIEEFLIRETNIFNIFDLAEITSPDVIGNEETIKMLLKK